MSTQCSWTMGVVDDLVEQVGFAAARTVPERVLAAAELVKMVEAIQNHANLRIQALIAEFDQQRFKHYTIAEAVRALLQERKVLHGREIEKLLMKGGMDFKGDNFQTVLATALKRCGGEFENIGRNRWRLRNSNTGQQKEEEA